MQNTQTNSTNSTNSNVQAALNPDKQMEVLEGLTAPLAASVLPQKTGDAMLTMMKLTQKLIDLSERETQALLQNDAFALNVTQDEKEGAAGRYMKAAQEFRARLEDFRTTDKPTLNRLEVLQNKLGEKMADNKKLIEQMYTKAHSSTHKTLFNVQELAQDQRFTFENDKEAENK